MTLVTEIAAKEKEIQQLFKKLGYDTSSIKLIGRGKHGKAFLLPRDKVAKITTSKHEAAVANKLIGRKNKWIVNYYKASKIKSKNIKNHYLIIMDRIEVGKFMIDFINGNSSINIFLKNKNVSDEILSPKQMYFLFEKLFQTRENYLKKLYSLFVKESKSPYKVMGSNVIKFYIGFLKESKEIGIRHLDFNENNIGFDLKSNRFKVFDFMGKGGIEPSEQIEA